MQHKPTADIFAEIDPMACYNSRLKMLNRAVTGIYDKAFKPFALNGNQFTLLVFIGKMKTTNQKTMADLLMINFTTISRDVIKLDTAGWIVIDKGEDARNSKISLSPKGMDIITCVVPVWSKINNQVRLMLGEGVSQDLNRMITKIKNRE